MLLLSRSRFTGAAEFSTTSMFVAAADTFVLEQPALALEPATVAGQRAVRSDETMARNHEADRIRAVREAHRADRQRTLQSVRHAPVAQSRSRGNCAQRPPHIALERSAAGLDGNLVDGLQFARKIAAQCATG